MQLRQVLFSQGFGTRRECDALILHGLVQVAGQVLDDPGAELAADGLAFSVQGQPWAYHAQALLMLHKPVGYTCSTKDPGRVVYDLLPPRFRLRNPVLSTVGRLDRDTSGLLLMTDDGALLHRITSPRSHLPKVYEATLAQDLRGDEAEVFGSGTLMLESETTPLAPAGFERLDARRARLSLVEGRYHQVRRMFAAVGNRVEALHRRSIGGLELGALAAGGWCLLDEAARDRLFGRP